MRPDGRAPGDLRSVRLMPGVIRHAEGSCRVEFGETVVLCAASVAAGVPHWRKGTGAGWLTAEYAMLPRSGMERSPRRQSGRASEIQRLIGRTLRAAVNLEAMGENRITVDCDVLEADGGTRTAAITGGMVAVQLATEWMTKRRMIRGPVITSPVAAVSVGIVETLPVLDLSYVEDVKAEVDMNVVMNAEGDYIEVQGAAEGAPFSKKDLGQMLTLAGRGIRKLITRQGRALEKARAASGP